MKVGKKEYKSRCPLCKKKEVLPYRTKLWKCFACFSFGWLEKEE